jgi:hypothetical protein
MLPDPGEIFRHSFPGGDPRLHDRARRLRRPASSQCADRHPDLTKGYRLQRVKADPDNPGDVLVILTLSGGGTRGRRWPTERWKRCAT